MTQTPSFSPDLFSPDAISEETRASNENIAKLMAAAPATNEREPAEIRKAREEGGGALGPLVILDEAKERVIPGRDGEITLRIIEPEGECQGVYFHIHGGGWVLGRAHNGDVRNKHISSTHGLTTVSVDYRLAPEDPYPAGPNDCEDTAVWLIENAASEFGSNRLLIGGESAGGHLAAVTALRMRDDHGYTGFLGANLVYGVFDLRPSPSSRNWGEKNLILNTAIMAWFTDHFVPEELRSDHDVSPVAARLHDMPPAIFTVGTMDPLLDDTLFMHARWAAAGNPATLSIAPGGIHGFNALPITIAKEANARIDAFLADCLQ